MDPRVGDNRWGLWLYRRPLLAVAVAFCVGEVCLITPLTVTPLLFAFAFVGTRRAPAYTAVAAAFALLGAGRLWVCAASLAAHEAAFRSLGSYAYVRGWICTEPRLAARSWQANVLPHYISSDGRCWRRGNGVLRASCPLAAGSPPHAGAYVLGEGKLSAVAGPRDPGVREAADVARCQGVSAEWRVATGVATAAGLEPIPGWLRVQAWGCATRQEVRRRLHGLLGTGQDALACGLLLGDTQGMPSAMVDDFAAAGISHLLAASGLNVGLVVSAVALLGQAIGLNRRRVAGVALGAVTVYTLAAGGDAPVARAAVMAAVYLGGTLLGRKADALNSLGAAALILLLVNPYDLFTAGFQLSVVTTAAICVAVGYFPRAPRPRRGDTAARLACAARDLALVAAVAQVASAPLVATWFHRVALLGFLANLLLGPLAAAATVVTLAVACFAWCGTPVALVAHCLLSPLLYALAGGARLVAEMPYASVATGEASGWVCAACYVGLATALWAAQRRLARP